MNRVFLIFALMLGLAAPALAQDSAPYLPNIPKATGNPHPEGNEYWRKHHMDLMKHDRDLTVHQGDRQIEASLKACFECHAVKDDNGQYVTVQDDRHFCRVCHDYAAVKVDCFMCHRSTPEGVDESKLQASTLGDANDPSLMNELFAYLENLPEFAPADTQGNSE